jgi:hypothetical protein
VGAGSARATSGGTHQPPAHAVHLELQPTVCLAEEARGESGVQVVASVKVSGNPSEPIKGYVACQA